ncbi:MAG: competence/damage-inducible protein A [Flavobacteriaceae bacterium]|nr:competence/damage-inducible protein A [Flavobacteriaceae bacterium]
MLAEIITIGDEILIGQIIDSNSAFIGTQLNKAGVSVYQITSIQDDKQHILNALEEASRRVDIVIVTGGLGPTKDDITKETFCHFFKDKLVENKKVLQQVKYLFEKVYSRPISEVNKQQALVPSKAIVLKNEFGTAPGMWMNYQNKVFVSLPGVPYEMKALIKNQVIPRLIDKYELPSIQHTTLLTQGRGESAIAEHISDFETKLPNFVKLAYLPSTGRVRLRLSGKHNQESILSETMRNLSNTLKQLVSDIFVGYEEEGSFEQQIGKLLIEKQATLSVAESCTGGAISQRITKNAGVSAFYKGGVVSYATDVKENTLQVSKELISQHSVVSEEVASAMAMGVKKSLQSDYAIATTGNAGPAKGESEEEVGTICIAIATPSSVFTKKFYFGKNRERVINKAVNMSFELLKEEILKN